MLRTLGNSISKLMTLFLPWESPGLSPGLHGESTASVSREQRGYLQKFLELAGHNGGPCLINGWVSGTVAGLLINIKHLLGGLLLKAKYFIL